MEETEVKGKVNINGEDLLLWWEGKELKVEGYDVESEVIAFILGGERGINASSFIYIVNEYGDRNIPMPELLDSLHMDDISRRSLEEEDEGSLIYSLAVFSFAENERILAARKGSLKAGEWARLAKDESFHVISEIVKRPDVSSDLLEGLARQAIRHENYEHIVSLADNPNINKNTILCLMDYPSEAILIKLARNPAVARDILIGFLEETNYEQCHWEIFKRVDFNRDLVKMIFKPKYVHLRRRYALRARNPKDIERLLKNRDYLTKLYLAQNISLSNANILALSDDPDPRITDAIMKRYDLAPGLLQELKAKIRLRPTISRNFSSERDFSL